MATNLPSPILGVALRCDRRAPRLARRALEEVLAAAPVLDDARLVVTELVNSAVLRSGCATDDIMRIMARLDGGFLVISVHVPVIAPRDKPEPAGFGLRIVQHLAERWGTESPDGHRVWAALPVSC